MTTQTHTPAHALAPALAPAPTNARAIRPLTFTRTCATELRKLVDTRSGVALLAAAVLLAGAFAGGRALFPDTDTDFGTLVTMSAGASGTLLMVMAILLVSAEFSARTASVTFVLDPRRGRTLAAKALVVVGVSLVVTALSFVAAALVMVVAPAFTGHTLAWTVDWARVAAVTGATLFTALAGLAWGLALRNAPAPIVILLVVPTITLLLGNLSAAVAEAVSYLNTAPTYAFLDGASGADVAKFATASAVWIVVPGAIGAWRLLRADIS